MGIKSIAVVVEKASLQFNQIANQVLTDYDLTPSQFRIITYIMGQPENTVRQIDIEKFFSLTNPTVTGIVQNLEKKELVKRIPNPDDRRSKVLSLTEKGRRLEKDVIRLNGIMEEKFTEKLTTKEKEQLLKLMKKMVDR